MSRFAQVLSTTVHWVFEAESNPYTDPTLDIRDITDVQPPPQEGWTAHADGTYAPPPVIPATPPSVMSRLAFQSRYTVTEQVTIELAADGTTAGFTPEQRATLRVLDRALQNATEIDLTDPRTVQGVQTHAALQLITAARATQILDPYWTPGA